MQKKQYTQPKVLVVNLKPEERLACCKPKANKNKKCGCCCDSTASFS